MMLLAYIEKTDVKARFSGLPSGKICPTFEMSPLADTLIPEEVLTMHVHVRALSFSLTKALQAAVLHHVERTLADYGQWIDKVSVRLSDINGPRGGQDKLCRMVVSLVPSGGLIAQATDSDMYAAIRRAADRAGAMVKRGRERQQTVRGTKPLVLADDGLTDDELGNDVTPVVLKVNG
jgi:ribosome-associated translation inhibitor RaiA